MKTIDIRGARTHNLQNIDLSLPRDKLIVFTGLSGSGKLSVKKSLPSLTARAEFVENLMSPWLKAA